MCSKIILILTFLILQNETSGQLWKSNEFLKNFSWFRQPRMAETTPIKKEITMTTNTKLLNTTETKQYTSPLTTIETTTKVLSTKKSTQKSIPSMVPVTTIEKNSTTQKITTVTPKTTIKKQETKPVKIVTTTKQTTTEFYEETTSTEDMQTTLESRDNARVNEYFHANKREKPQVKIATNISQNLLPLPAGAGAALVKPTKYHYYPHNQHIYLLPECAIQQVCNAVYVRLNWTQPLCACPSRYRDPCSASLNSDDLHTTELITDPNMKRALTLVKTCEPTAEMRLCRTPRDWSLLALQNIRTGKSHYLVICRCPDTSILEGPMSHDQPTYASVPGIRVYGMMCVQSDLIRRRGRPLRLERSVEDEPAFPWDKAVQLYKTAEWN